MTRLIQTPDMAALPGDVYFRYEDFAPGSYSHPHSHDFGQLNYVAHGTMTMHVEGQVFLSPAQWAVWIPPGRVHSSYNAGRAVYRSVYVARRFCARLPVETCALAISGILQAILMDFGERRTASPETPQDRRLARVLLDQLAQARPARAWLPSAPTPVTAAGARLGAVLAAMRAAPASPRRMRDWAEAHAMTPRTLERLARRELGMSLGDWRARMRYLLAIEGLEAGRPVHVLATELGYATPSAFIAMFRRFAGMTPEQYRARSTQEAAP